MACACNKGTATTGKKSYTVTTPSGSTKTFTNEADAKLYAARSGGTIK